MTRANPFPCRSASTNPASTNRVAVAAAAWCLWASVGFADPPTDRPAPTTEQRPHHEAYSDNDSQRPSHIELQLPADVELPPHQAASDAAEEKIRQALRGEPVDDGGNEMLGDVLDVLKHRGSVLEGSSLDPDIGDPLPGINRPDARSSSRVSESPIDPSQAARPPESADAVLRAAEGLLRAARLLEQTEPTTRSVHSGGHRQLTLQMRLAAAELLIRWRDTQQAR